MMGYNLCSERPKIKRKSFREKDDADIFVQDLIKDGKKYTIHQESINYGPIFWIVEYAP